MNWQGSKPCSRRIGPGFPDPVRFVFDVSEVDVLLPSHNPIVPLHNPH
jgi:hypothetical protein